MYICVNVEILGLIDEEVNSIIQNCGDHWRCLHCSKTAKTKQHIKYHAESHLAVEHPCSYCGKCFRTSHSLSNHMSRYHKV